MNYNLIANKLDHAARYAKSIEQISVAQKFGLEESYAIQSISIGKRYERGEQKTGIKLGFTSKAKMEQMGVHDMIWGRLTSKMKYDDGSSLLKSDFIHPRAEPEIAFHLSKDVDKLLSKENYLDYIDGVAVAIEIIDSRFTNFKFSLEDVIADNCSSSGYIVGEWMDAKTNLQDLKIELLVDGSVVQQGNSNAILGNPLESLFAASRLALENGEQLSKGQLILAGAATPAVYIEVGQVVKATAESLGAVSIQVK
jgi:2-oxo-3-hexenedioate decarboxylase